jgi:uncharacterized membrane protein
VTVVSQSAGFVALLVALAVAGGGMNGRSFALGFAAGVGGGAGLAAFYRALAVGTMSIVSPVVACGAIVPSVEESRAPARERAQAVLLAAVAAVCLGLFTYFLGLGSREGSALSTLVGARVGSLICLLLLAARLRAPLRVGRAAAAPVAAIGLADVGANALFALASGRGLLALVSVLGSLYPVTTVLLAHVVLGERLTRFQRAGVGVALAGVAALSVG